MKNTLLLLLVSLVGCNTQESPISNHNSSNQPIEGQLAVSYGKAKKSEFAQHIAFTFKRATDKETLQLKDGVYKEDGFVIKQSNIKRDAFVFAGGWYLIHERDGIPQFGISPGWLLVQDDGAVPDGIAEFRAQYSVKTNKPLDFSKDGKATFVLDVIDGNFIAKEPVDCVWKVKESQ